MRRFAAASLAILSLALTLSAEGPAEKLAQTSTTKDFPFAPGGTVRFIQSYGSLYVEGWDQPRVEITVTKSSDYTDDAARLQGELTTRLASIQVSAEKRSESEIAITTVWAPRKDWAPPLAKVKTNGVHLEYRVFVPRGTRLVVDHHGGIVQTGNTTGDIEAANRDGDILLMLPAKGVYAIDAQSRMGHIASEFEGHTISRYVVGQRFTSPAVSSSRRIHLRTGFGGITIVALPPEGEALSQAGSQQ